MVRLRISIFASSKKEIHLVTIHTIGHSTRTADEFIQLLRANHIQLLADVRRFPGSRFAPQFNREALRISLKKSGIEYIHLEELGGRRNTMKDSMNTGWRNKSFRGFADYMQTAAFSNSLEELIAHATRYHAAIMCAEAVPWKCHRSLIADALLIRGFRVINILSLTHNEEHQLTSFAEVSDGGIFYPPKNS